MSRVSGKRKVWPVEDMLYLSLLSFASLFYAFYKVGFGDFWMHLAQGRYILDHKTIPVTDVFSYTHYGVAWSNWEWLHNVMIAIIWESSGAPGIILFRMAVFALLIACCYLILRGVAASPFWAYLFSCVTLLLLQVRVADRPHLLSYLFLAALLLVGIVESLQSDRRRMVMAVIVLILWRNTHPSWILGCALTTVFFLDHGYRTIKKGAFSHRALLSSSFLLLLLLLIGFFATPLPLDLSAHFSLQAGEKTVIEWRSLFSRGPALVSFYYILFFLYSAIFVVAMVRYFKQRPFYSLLTVLVLTNAYWHDRFIPESVLLGMPVVCLFLAGHIRPRFSMMVFHRGTILIALGIFSLTVFASENIRSVAYAKRGMGVDEKMVPLYAAEFINDHDLGGNVFGQYWMSMDFLMGYCYPSVKVALDTRVPGLYPYHFADAYWSLSSVPEFTGLVLSLPLDYLLLGHQETRATAAKEQVFERVLMYEGYELLYFDRFSALYRSPRGRINASGGHDLSPFKLLSRWNTDKDALSSLVAAGRFTELLDELTMLKKHTAGRDDFYREVFAVLYAIPELSDKQKEYLEEAYGQDATSGPTR